MRIIVADNQTKVRFALRISLERKPELVIVGEAADADELTTLLDQARPDMVIFDWLLPGLQEIGSLEALRKKYPGLLLIALSGRPELGRIALAAGADAFVSKIDPPERLLSAVAKCEKAYQAGVNRAL